MPPCLRPREIIMDAAVQKHLQRVSVGFQLFFSNRMNATDQSLSMKTLLPVKHRR